MTSTITIYWNSTKCQDWYCVLHGFCFYVICTDPRRKMTEAASGFLFLAVMSARWLHTAQGFLLASPSRVFQQPLMFSCFFQTVINSASSAVTVTNHILQQTWCFFQDSFIFVLWPLDVFQIMIFPISHLEKKCSTKPKGISVSRHQRYH